MDEIRSMRDVFGEALAAAGRVNDRLVVLDCDVSCSTQTELFDKEFPDRFFQCGIAEANMVSIAAGMAAVGLIPVASTFAFLLAFRAGDAVRSQVAYNRLNVKLAGGYCGMSDFADGGSHQSVSDLAVMRAIPNMRIWAPSDITSTAAAVRRMIETDGPIYLRLSRDTVPRCYDAGAFTFDGRARVVRTGGDVTILSCGSMLHVALQAAKLLTVEGIAAEVIDCLSLKPLDAETLLASIEKTSAVVTVEEHNIIGGLGSAVAGLLVESGSAARLCRIGITDCFGESGTYDQLLKKYGLTPSAVAKAAAHLKAGGRGRHAK